MPQRIRKSTVSVLAAGVALALIGVAVGLNVTQTQDAKAPVAPVTTPPPVTSSAAIEDLLFDLQIIPMDGQAPRPFTLPSLDGKPLSLSDLKGRAALLYFWATW